MKEGGVDRLDRGPIEALVRAVGQGRIAGPEVGGGNAQLGEAGHVGPAELGPDLEVVVGHQASQQGGVQRWRAAGHQILDDVMHGRFRSVPPNFYGYSRGWPTLLINNPVAAEWIPKWEAAYGDEHPIPDQFTFQLLSTWQMAKALIEQTGTVDPEAWKALIETGTFGFEGPYNPGLTYVNPINHMAQTCVDTGAMDDAGQDSTGSPDATPDQAMESGSLPAFTTDENANVETESACGCRGVGSRAPGVPWALLYLTSVGLLIVGRRRLS